MSDTQQTAISPTRSENFPEWYQQVIRHGELAENSSVRGCMVIKPWGYGIWENIQRHVDTRIKATGHENAYFPLFIPLSYLEKEATHVEGFAKECAVVTHHRLEQRDGKLIPTAELEEPLIVRPTSETIIGESFAKWVQSYRDLPLLINQWANVVRWEMRPRIFLRTSEFLWQEGHTVHASADEAMEETKRMLQVYKEVAEDILALPLIAGEKIASERFPGAVRSLTIEAMMQDRKAIQAGTSHYLGQNFAKASGIKFLNKSGEQEYGYTTSWAVSTRLIGGLIMAHSDDDGLCLPPRIAPKQVVILPVIPKPEHETAVIQYAEEIRSKLAAVQYDGRPLEVILDRRDIRGGEKSWQWIKKGVPIRIEVGPRDINSRVVTLYRRDRPHKERYSIDVQDVSHQIDKILHEMQSEYFEKAQTMLQANLRNDITSLEEFKQFFTPKDLNNPEIHGGFVRAKFADVPEAQPLLAELKVTVRCMPFEQSGSSGKCIITGKPTNVEAIFAKAY